MVVMKLNQCSKNLGVNCEGVPQKTDEIEKVEEIDVPQKAGDGDSGDEIEENQ